MEVVQEAGKSAGGGRGSLNGEGWERGSGSEDRRGGGTSRTCLQHGAVEAVAGQGGRQGLQRRGKAFSPEPAL